MAQQPGVVEEMATAIVDRLSQRVVATGIVYSSYQVRIKNAVVDGVHGAVVESGLVDEAGDASAGVFFHTAHDASVAFVSTVRALGHMTNVPVYIASTPVTACVLNLGIDHMEESQEKVKHLLHAQVHLIN